MRRVVIHSTDYLDYDGGYSPGGRPRFIRDLAMLVRDGWQREVLVVQKSRSDFSKACKDGLPVIGIKSSLRAYGDPEFGYRVSKLIKPTDGLLYASGEDAWPFFREGAKAIQHGVWWDGPESWFVRQVQRHRAMSCMEAIQSMLCVDTNFINWLRCQGGKGFRLCQKCVYVPNYADTLQIKPTSRSGELPLRLICARRFEEKRGTLLFIRALGLLKKSSFPFTAHIATVGGVREIAAELASNKLTNEVTVTEDSMEQILERYASFDVAVVPTIWSEGTSLACVEAICAGLPVITTPVGGLGNLVVPEFNGFIIPPSPDAIAGAIRRFSNFDLWREMNANCVQMRSALSISRWRQQVLDWLDN